MVKMKTVLTPALGYLELKFKAINFFLQLSWEFKQFSSQFHACTLYFILYFLLLS